MTGNQWLALGLLISRFVTVVLMYKVVVEQIRELKRKDYRELDGLRKTLLAGSIVLLLANFVPILIDSLGVFGKGSFSLLVLYVVSNNITTLFAAYLVLYNIRLAKRVKLMDKSR